MVYCWVSQQVSIVSLEYTMDRIHLFQQNIFSHFDESIEGIINKIHLWQTLTPYLGKSFEGKLNKNSVLWKTFFTKLWQKFNGYDWYYSPFLTFMGNLTDLGESLEGCCMGIITGWGGCFSSNCMAICFCWAGLRFLYCSFSCICCMICWICCIWICL